MARNQFARTVKVKKPGKNVFDRSFGSVITCDPDYAVPIFCQPVVPSDVMQLSTELFCRFQPLVVPVMHRMNCYVRYFYVTYRQIWPQFDEYLKAAITGAEVWPEKPNITLKKDLRTASNPDPFGHGSLADYLNFPSFDLSLFTSDYPGTGKVISSLKFRAYQHIWNEWFRNEVTQEPLDMSAWSDPNDNASSKWQDLFLLRKVQWEKDMFTSALPSPQLGEDVSMVMDFDADVDYINDPDVAGRLVDYAGDPVGANSELKTNDQGEIIGDSAPRRGFNYDPNGSLKVVNGQVRTPTVNEWRKMFAVQRVRELAARTGTRLREIILGHFGERVPDLRLEVPEYLGGYKTNVVISEVLQTSESAHTPQGNQSGKGMVYAGQFNFKRKFKEHGFVIGIAYFRPTTTYFQGFERQDITFDPTEEFWPTFQHLGEQAITNQEVYYDPAATDNEDVFGYTPRYAEMRASMDQIHGDIRGSLSDWTFARRFTSRPGLNADFTTAQTSLDPFAVQDQDFHRIVAQFQFHLKMVRPLSKYGTPSFI